MEILSWIFVGAIAGWLAGMVIKGRGFGQLGDIIIGVVGGLIGGWLAGVLFKLPDAVNGIKTINLVAFLGAIVLLAVLRLFQGLGHRSLLHR